MNTDKGILYPEQLSSLLCNWKVCTNTDLHMKMTYFTSIQWTMENNLLWSAAKSTAHECYSCRRPRLITVATNIRSLLCLGDHKKVTYNSSRFNRMPPTGKVFGHHTDMRNFLFILQLCILYRLCQGTCLSPMPWAKCHIYCWFRT